MVEELPVSLRVWTLRHPWLPGGAFRLRSKRVVQEMLLCRVAASDHRLLRMEGEERTLQDCKRFFAIT